MSGLTNDEYVKAFRKAGAITSHNVQRQNKTGWFSPESQRDKGTQAPGSIVFSHEKAVNLGRASRENKMFPKNSKFILSRAYEEIFCITGCSSSADILAVAARIDPVIGEKSKNKNFRFSRIVEDSTKSTFNWRCKKIVDDLATATLVSQQKSVFAVPQELQNATYYNVFDRYK